MSGIRLSDNWLKESHPNTIMPSTIMVIATGRVVVNSKKLLSCIVLDGQNVIILKLKLENHPVYQDDFCCFFFREIKFWFSCGLEIFCQK